MKPISGGLRTDKEDSYRRLRRIPKTLYVAIAVLGLVMMIYLTKLAVLAIGLLSGFGKPELNIIVFVFEFAMIVLTIDSIIGITSNRPKAWRKVERSCIITMMAMSIGSMGYNENLASSLVVVEPVYMVALAIPFVMMFRHNVREYYTPPMTEVRPVKDWLLFILTGSIYPPNTYELKYPDESAKNKL